MSILANLKKTLDGIASMGLSDPDAKVVRDELLRHFAVHQLADVRDPVTAIATRMEAEENRRLYPYKAKVQKSEADWLNASKSTVEELEAAYDDAAKNGLLDIPTMVVGAYVLFGSREDQLTLMAMLLHLPYEATVTAHNVAVANAYGPSFMGAHGETVVSMSVPLFPARKTLQTTNVKLLQKAKVDSISGGSAPSDWLPHGMTTDMFRQDPTERPHGGEYFAPVLNDDSGRTAVDMSRIDTQLSRILRNLGSYTRGRGGAAHVAQGTRVCNNCGKAGHLSRECRAPKQQQRPHGGEPDQTEKGF